MWTILNSNSRSWNLVERVLYPSPVPTYSLSSFPGELIIISREDGQDVPCLFLPFCHARYVVIFFHANAEDLGTCRAFCTAFRELFQVHVLAVEYPGYGICHGKTDEAGILANAEAAMHFVMNTLGWCLDGIMLFGRSTGTAPAVALAHRFEVCGVILVSPFTSIQDLFKAQLGQLAELISSSRFSNIALVPEIKSPTLIVHGQDDTLVPVEHGQEIHEAMTCKRMLVCPSGMGHNTSLLRDVHTFVLPITQFFSMPDYIFDDIQVPAHVFPSSSFFRKAHSPLVRVVSERESLCCRDSRSLVPDAPPVVDFVTETSPETIVNPKPRSTPNARALDAQDSLRRFPFPVMRSDDDIPDAGIDDAFLANGIGDTLSASLASSGETQALSERKVSSV